MSTALNANALVTLAQAKAELNIPSATTTEDDRVTGFVNAASDYLEHTCNRKFTRATYTDYFDGSGTAYLKGYEFPIRSVTSVNVDDTRAFQPATDVSTGAIQILRDVVFVRCDGSFWHAYRPLNTKIVYIAGYDNQASPSEVPFDLQQACLEVVKILYLYRNDNRMGLATKTKLGENTSYLTDKLPPTVETLIAYHRREAYVASRLQGIVLGGTGAGGGTSSGT